MTAPTFAMLPIVDAVAALPTLTTGMTIVSGVQPVWLLPATLYAWVASQTPVPDGTGNADRADFRLSLEWCVDGGGEAQTPTRMRAVSAQLDAAAVEIMRAVQGNRSSDLWEFLRVEGVDYAAAMTFAVRSVRVDISGYRLITS